jgi:hypothetical protein
MISRFPFDAALYASLSHQDLDVKDRASGNSVLLTYPELKGWCPRSAWVAWSSYSQTVHETGWRDPSSNEPRELEFLDYLAMRQNFGPHAVLGLEDRLTVGRAIWRQNHQHETISFNSHPYTPENGF